MIEKMKNVNKKAVLSGIFLSLVFSCISQTLTQLPNGSPAQKKLIHLGWEAPTTQILSKNYKMMEATSPFDGITLIIRDTIDGNLVHEDLFFSKHEIKREWLRKSLDRLKSCKFNQFADNFVRITTVPEGLNWTDDKAWATVCSNMGNLAWFAKEGGLKGISYDPESYTKKIFEWDASAGMSYEDSKKLARKRGREMMTAIGKEYPDITFFGLFLLSLGRSASDSPNIDGAFSADVYALYPSFINGMLDALPLKAKMVEGNEDAYYCPDREELLSLYTDSKNKLLQLFAPENITKMQTQYSVGFGLYIDMYSNRTPEGRFYFGEQNNRSRIERFRDRLQEAVSISDEYVWVYNEKYRWWNIPYFDERFNSIKTDSLWKDVFPLINDYLLYAKNPVGYISSVLNKGKQVNGNLTINSTFDEKTEKAKSVIDWYNKNCPPGYLMWCADTAKGKIDLVPNEGVNRTACAKISKSKSILIQQIKVIPGEQYVIAVDGQKTGGEMNFGIFWMDSYKNLVRWYQWKYFSFQPVNGTDWSRAVGVVTVPDDISSMELLIMPQFINTSDVFRIDNVRVYPLNEIFK